MGNTCPYFDHVETYRQFIGAVMKSPILLHNVPNPVTIDDFPKNSVCAARQVFYAISIVSNQKSTEITPDDIISVLMPATEMYATFRALNGEEFLDGAYNCGNPEQSNFTFYYNQLKRNSLLRELKLKGYDISKYDIDEANETLSKERHVIQDNYNNATEEEILGYVEQQFNLIKTKFSGGSLGSSDAADGIFELIASLGKNGDYGLPICGEMLSSIVRGKRLGCMYLRSAGTGGSKTRSSVFDACAAVYPIIWRENKDPNTGLPNGTGNWCINTKVEPQRTLFVMTEQTPNEIRLMMLAYISGIEERRIKSNLLTESEKARVQFAAQEMEYFKGYFKFEEINDPNLHNVSNVIKKHIIQNDVKYIYYDYIFASPSLLSELNKNLRTDQALMLLSNQLKELAKTYNVFIMTSTQLNGEGLASGRKRDQSMLSNAKSIADKADVGMIIAPVDDVELELVKNIVEDRNSNKAGLVPTHVIDVYKIRSGRFRGVRVWTHFNPGNGRRIDLFITDSDNHHMNFEEGEKIEDTWENEHYTFKLSTPELAAQKLLEIPCLPAMTNIQKESGVEF